MCLWLVGKPNMPRPENITIGIFGGDDSVTFLEIISSLECNITILVADSTNQV